jgi:diacylglycerol kinase family enzyme
LLQVWRSLRPLFVEILIDGEPAWSGRVYQLGIGNGCYHGGGLEVAPDAAIDDGKLDIYLVQPGRLSQLLASLLHLKFSFARPEVLKRTRATSVTLRAPRPYPINADGELVTQTPAVFAVLPGALTVMAPADQ